MFPTDRHQYFSLRWNNYQNNMTSVFHQLLENQSFVDVTLACENNSLKAHKVVLSACSTFFQKLLLDNPCDHATIIMPSDICFADLQFIIKFVYRGEIDVSEPELQSLLRTAEHLKIKGLCEISEDYPEPCVKKKLKNNQRIHYQSIKTQDINIKCNSLSSNILDTSSQAINSSNEDLTKQHNDTSSQSSSIILEPRSVASNDNREKNMTSLGMGMGMNGGSLMGVSMQFLDFAPEPPAPSATPVTEHVELNSNSTQDHEIRRKFETLRSLDPSDNLEVDRLSQHSIHHLTQQSLSSPHHSENSRDHLRQPLPDTIIIKQQVQMEGDQGQNQSIQQHVQQQQQQHQQQQQQHHQQQMHDHQGQSSNMDIDQNSGLKQEGGLHGMIITPEIVSMMSPTQMDLYQSDTSEDSKMLLHSEIKVEYTELTSPNDPRNAAGPKTWTPEDMESALDALRTHHMSLSKASVTYGIPPTTLWQRAHRLGIDTPKKEGPLKSWNEDSLNCALDALRTGQISANKASKAYGIPSSTLYKIARREGIRLAAPFNAAPTTWTQEDLDRALEAIRSGQASVQKASVEFGIPTGTLYGRCKREGIELSRSNPTPWSEDAMMEALEAVRVGQMSINQAAIHYNLPYSSLYGRFKRGKYDSGSGEGHVIDTSPESSQKYSPGMLSHQQPQSQDSSHLQTNQQISSSQDMYLITPKQERS